MPFSVKATYGRSGELRKFTFPGQFFPTYDQLYNQLYRVFPISHNYYLSTLLFSPDLSNSKSSILLGQEIHNEEEYKSRIFPYGNGIYSNAMLRFTVFDETPHKLPAGFVPADNTPAPLNGGGAPNPFISVSHIPPPPIILSSAGPSASMDVDAASDGSSSSSTSTPMPQQHQSPQSTAGSCCAVSESKIEIQGMVSKFKEDLDRILKSSFATPAPTPTALPPAAFIPPMLPSVTPSSFCLFKYCTTCAKIFQGPWFACEKCSIVVCLSCHEAQGNTFCVTSMAPHIMKKEVCAACPVEAQPPRMSMGPAPWAAWQQSMMPPQLQGYSPIYPFQTQPQVSPFVPGNELPRAPAPAAAAPLPPLPVPSVAQVPTASAPPAPPVIHRGVVCDMCDNVVEGIRHKCLDCPNYDLCTSCIESGSAERHNPFHEFLEIREPGRVIVHTVYSGDGERDAQGTTSARAPAPTPQTEVQPAVHYATCNLCDSRIRGDRYKCADCPDFDTCSNCFSITREQHPHHAFVKLSNASDYIRRENPSPPMHFVKCDGCSSPIHGIRYKCMHPECPDFDLCESCEAFPIPVHPDTHPLLKMRSPSTIVPTVYRVGQTTMINREETSRGRSPPAQRVRSRSSSFGPGFMSDPNERRNTVASFFSVPPPFGAKPPFAPKPPVTTQQPYFSGDPYTVLPPSPFFFRSESSRSSSPVMAYQPPRPISPTYAPRPPSPMMMPGGLYDEPAFARQPQPVYNGFSYGRAQPTASRFSHSPSPSLPPESPRLISRSPSPPAPARHSLPWGAPVRSQTQYDGPSGSFITPQLRQQLLIQQQQQHSEEQRRRTREFWIAQDLAQAEKMDQERREAEDRIANAQAKLAHHIDEEQMRWARAPAVPPTLPPSAAAEPAFPSYWPKSSEELTLPPFAAPLGDAEPTFPSYWPKSSEELRHLMQHDEPVIDAFSRLSVQEEPAAVMDSPLTGALLTRNSLSVLSQDQASREEAAAPAISYNHSLAALLNGYESENEAEKKDEPLISITKEEPTPVPTPPIPALALAPAAPSLAPAAVPVPIPVPAPALGLRATFVNDVTLPDGQIFPPGAEFMKCWQMVNSGSVDWPAGTELVYVAGERLAREVGGPASVPIGSVKVGAEVELWTSELKAPETPGRYVSYWRLRDGQHRLFGESIWIEYAFFYVVSPLTFINIFLFSSINVTETRSNESSLSSSSIIVMPRGAQSVPTSSAVGTADVRGEAEEYELSDHGSDASSGSLISVPTSDDEEWASVPAEQPPQAQRYVVLYDDASSQSSGSDIE
ncbi:hypothetical protein B0H12DRAFT_761399 [Mycena haematopus]|nr:hypothetical protein B0H12DRAFT_761399 [Mycena haematopus]